MKRGIERSEEASAPSSAYSTVYPALENKDTNTAKALVIEGADITLKTAWDWTVLHLIARDNLTDFLDFLCDHYSTSFPKEILSEFTAHGKSALEIAVELSRKEVAIKLLTMMDYEQRKHEIERMLPMHHVKIKELFELDVVKKVPALALLAYQTVEQSTQRSATPGFENHPAFDVNQHNSLSQVFLLYWKFQKEKKPEAKHPDPQELIYQVIRNQVIRNKEEKKLQRLMKLLNIDHCMAPDSKKRKLLDSSDIPLPESHPEEKKRMFK